MRALVEGRWPAGSGPTPTAWSAPGRWCRRAPTRWRHRARARGPAHRVLSEQTLGSRHERPGTAGGLRRRLVGGDRRLHAAARGAAGRRVVDAHRPAGLGRPRLRRAHRPSRGGALGRARGDPRGRAGAARRVAGPGLHRAGRGRPARRDARRADQRDPRERHEAPHLPADRPARRRHGDAAPDARRHPLELADPAAQPAAGRVDARAGRTTCGRPPGRPRHRAGPAHRRLPARGDGHGARQAGRRAAGLDAGGRGRGQQPGGVRDLGLGARRAAARGPGRPDRASCGWTARRSSSWPAAGARRRTSTSLVAGDADLAPRILAGMAITP